MIIFFDYSLEFINFCCLNSYKHSVNDIYFMSIPIIISNTNFFINIDVMAILLYIENLMVSQI